MKVSLDPPLDDALREGLIDLWTDVSNAGGAVGFVPPVTREMVARLGAGPFAGVSAGTDHLVVGRLAADASLAGFLFLETRPSPLFAHWATVKRLQVRTDLKGQGLGRALLLGAHDLARGVGLEMLHLTVRQGTGLEGFYQKLGYTLVGQIPGAIRVAPGDDRDELHFVCRL